MNGNLISAFCKLKIFQLFSICSSPYDSISLYPVYPYLQCVHQCLAQKWLSLFSMNVSHILKVHLVKDNKTGHVSFQIYLVCDIAYFNTVVMNLQEFLYRAFMFAKSKSPSALLHISSIIPVKVLWLKVPLKQTINISRGVFVFSFIWCVFHCVCLFHVLSSKHKRWLSTYFKICDKSNN